MTTEKLMQESYQIAEKTFDLDNRDYLLNRSLQELGSNFQSVILLKYYADLSYTEIAETLGIPEKKVKSRLFDARQMLKEKLSESGFFSAIHDI